MPVSPLRVKVQNELGTQSSLPCGHEYLVLSGHGQDALILCPGPEPQLCADLLDPKRNVFLLTVEPWDSQMPEHWHAAIPPQWTRITLEQAHALLPGAQCLHYRPATRIFPSIFAPLLARAALVHNTPQPLNGVQRTFPLAAGGTTAQVAPQIWLPAPPDALIVPELVRAAHTLGLQPCLLPAPLDPAMLRSALQVETPRLFLSINFHGLDAWGENQALLEAAGVQLAVWCVDNPFHLLSAQKNLLWKRLPLAVTDAWFLAPLEQLGARPFHLPLGTGLSWFGPGPVCPHGQDILFVGRAAFPDKDRFFAAVRVPETLMSRASALAGRSAHFGWWHEQMPGQLWPGNGVRTPGLGAEQCSATWRTHCLRALAATGPVTIIGDQKWQELVPGARLLPPVDYYHGLAAAYRSASFSLNLTSLLLPHGLTQRHFDVWSCGGFLLTDASPGLEIFPADLARAVSFDSPEQAREMARDFAAHPKRKDAVRRAWQDLVRREHTYERRLERILAVLESAPKAC